MWLPTGAANVPISHPGVNSGAIAGGVFGIAGALLIVLYVYRQKNLPKVNSTNLYKYSLRKWLWGRNNYPLCVSFIIDLMILIHFCVKLCGFIVCIYLDVSGSEILVRGYNIPQEHKYKFKVLLFYFHIGWLWCLIQNPVSLCMSKQ